MVRLSLFNLPLVLSTQGTFKFSILPFRAIENSKFLLGDTELRLRTRVVGPDTDITGVGESERTSIETGHQNSTRGDPNTNVVVRGTETLVTVSVKREKTFYCVNVGLSR